VEAAVVNEKPVWDLPLRLFHWALAACIFVALWTGFIAPENWLDAHTYAGYGLCLLLPFRLIWGLVGGRYSRFSSFPLAWRQLVAHLKTIWAQRPAQWVGHNPAGSWMIIVMLILLALAALSGLVTLGGQENLGPLAGLISYRRGNDIGEIHELFAWAIVIAVGVHLAGVAVEILLSKAPLVRAMITGRKSVDEGLADHNQPKASTGFWIAVAVIVVVLFEGYGLSTFPGDRWRPIGLNATYKSECGDCHHPHHPSLRSRDQWRRLLSALDNHFGEDASLSPRKMAEIGGFLGVNAAESFDTEVANRLGRIDTPTGRATETRYWMRRHRDLDEMIFKTKAVGSKVNCDACHTDAASGRFDDAAIALPKETKK